MRILITGITGQDGSYLAEELLSQGHEVHGVRRRSSSFNTSRINHLYNNSTLSESRLFLHYADMVDSSSLARVIEKVEPDQIYNLAAQSHVAVSFEEPEYTVNADAMGVTRILEVLRRKNWSHVNFYQASTSEMFGNSPAPQSETTPFEPQSPYAVAKVCAFFMVKNYRDAYSLRASNGILFNHESPRRGETFVTRKITRGLVRAMLDPNYELSLGNIDSVRDWGHAKDYVRGMIAIQNYHAPEDFVLATGITRSVRQFLVTAARFIGMELEFSGFGEREVAIDKRSGRIVMRINPIYFRPNEVPFLQGDYSKARKLLDWKPEISFETLVEEMMQNDLQIVRTKT